MGRCKKIVNIFGALSDRKNFWSPIMTWKLWVNPIESPINTIFPGKFVAIFFKAPLGRSKNLRAPFCIRPPISVCEWINVQKKESRQEICKTIVHNKNLGWKKKKKGLKLFSRLFALYWTVAPLSGFWLASLGQWPVSGDSFAWVLILDVWNPLTT